MGPHCAASGGGGAGVRQVPVRGSVADAALGAPPRRAAARAADLGMGHGAKGRLQILDAGKAVLGVCRHTAPRNAVTACEAHAAGE